MNFSIDAVLPWKWLRLDPARTQAARRHFDLTGRYNAWHNYCQSVYAGSTSSSGGVFERDGVETVKCLTPAEAAELKQLVLAKATNFGPSKKTIDYADVLQFDDSAFLYPTIEKMLSEAVHSKVTAVFGSDYYVHSLVINRTMPAKASRRSFLWHCDRGPKDFVKINMFLDATQEHGGTTEFLTLEDSKVFEDAGYTFGANARRISDLGPLSRRLKVTPKVLHPQLQAGEAFMFYPARSLHRGFLPTKGIRHMLSIVLLPSPIHWRKAWEKTVKSGYHLKTQAAFPDDAETLFEKIGAPPVSLGAFAAHSSPRVAGSTAALRQRDFDRKEGEHAGKAVVDAA